MSFKATMKAQKAYALQGKGDNAGAKALYEEAMALGLNDPRFCLAYALLMIRSGDYKEARELLVKIQKMPGLTNEQRTDLFVDYACCVFRMGELDKGVSLLERQHAKQPSGLIYQTLGYLYCEKYDLSRKAETLAKWAEAPAKEDEGTAEDAEEDKTGAADPEERWDEEVDKALKFNLAAVDYDDEDPICLDNLGQFYYRALNDKDTALEYFTKAIEFKEGQIDTLYFLSRYDLEAGDKEAALEKLEKALEGRFSPLNFCDKEKIQLEIARIKSEK